MNQRFEMVMNVLTTFIMIIIILMINIFILNVKDVHISLIISFFFWEFFFTTQLT